MTNDKPEKVEEKVEETEIPQPKEADHIKYDYGTLVQECFVCGEQEVKMEDVDGGLQFFLPTTDKHEMKMTCQRCKASMRMFWKESSKKKTEDEKKADE